MTRITVEGTQELQAALRKYGKRAEAEIGKAVQATAIEVRTDIQNAIQRGPKTGRTYTRGTVSHTASAPGEAPATDTGTLAASVIYKKIGVAEAEIVSRAPDDSGPLEYAAMLEFGTARIEPRPSWTPAAEKARPRLQDRVNRALRKLDEIG